MRGYVVDGWLWEAEGVDLLRLGGASGGFAVGSGEQFSARSECGGGAVLPVVTVIKFPDFVQPATGQTHRYTRPSGLRATGAVTRRSVVQWRLPSATRAGGHKQAVLCHGRGSAADAKVGNIESRD